ncbi:MAG: hypothetical protein WC522_06215 [Candidatus Omnitrophota bacterium]
MKTNELDADVIDEKPVRFDFSKGFGKTWEIPFEHKDSDEYYPMTNYAYLLPEEFKKDLRGKDIKKMANECSGITLVYLICLERYALALTGCGMDHSWEICEAYVNFGYLPPIHFCDLPELSGIKFDEKTQELINACKKSLEISSGYAYCLKERLCGMESNLKGVII